MKRAIATARPPGVTRVIGAVAVAVFVTAAVLMLYTLHNLQWHYERLHTGSLLEHQRQSSSDSGAARQLAQLQEQVTRLQHQLKAAEFSAAADSAATAATLSGDQLLAEHPKDQLLAVAFTNGGYAELMLNWVAHLRQIGVAHIVVVYDDEAAAACHAEGVPFLQAGHKTNATVFRYDKAALRAAGAAKPAMVLRLFEEHGLRAVLLSDTDAVWLRDPAHFTAQHPTAHLFVSSDCLSHKAEAEQVRDVYRCGHVAGSHPGRFSFNSGITIWRDRPSSRQILREWHAALIPPDLEGQEAGAWARDEQLELNTLLQQPPDTPFAFAADAPAVFLAHGGALQAVTLPALLFANGHTMFLQHLPERYGVVPYAVHATFQYQRSSIAGKRARLRQAGLWLRDPPSYHTDGSFMLYANTVAAYVDEQERKSPNGLVWLHKHFLAAAYQLAAVRDAFAIAAALNRTLILPQFLCYCDQDQVANVLEDCTMKGTDMQLPFACPAEHFLLMARLENSSLPFRMANFLELHQVPLKLSRSVTPVLLHWSPEEAAQKGGIWTTHYAGHVTMGMNDLQLQAALQQHAQARVLSWQDLRPGAFAGFVVKGENDNFDTKFKHIAEYSGWCCSGGRWDPDWMIDWAYVLPQPLASTKIGSDQWQANLYNRPKFCSNGDLTRENVEFALLANHPCQFLPAGGSDN